MTSEQVKQCIATMEPSEHIKLVNIARRYVRSQDVAEDCVQDAYVAAMVQCQQIRQTESLRAWLKTVTVRNAYCYVRNYNNIMKLCLKSSRLGEWEDMPEIAAYIVADSFASVLKLLPVNTREIMILKYIHGQSFIEIANEMHMSSAAVRQAHQRAKKMLQKREKYIRSLVTD